MADTVNIQVRMHLPEGRPGDVIAVDPDRADALVNARYAVYTDDEPTTEPTAIITTGPSPAVELPNKSDTKDAWEAAAAQLGVATVDDEGKPVNKDDLIDAVTKAAGG